MRKQLDFMNEKIKQYSKGYKRGHDIGSQNKRQILIEKIDKKIEQLENVKSEFKNYMLEDEFAEKEEKKFWSNEITTLIMQQRMLRSFKDELYKYTEVLKNKIEIDYNDIEED